MKKTYRAVQVSKPGTLEVVEARIADASAWKSTDSR